MTVYKIGPRDSKPDLLISAENKTEALVYWASVYLDIIPMDKEALESLANENFAPSIVAADTMLKGYRTLIRLEKE